MLTSMKDMLVKAQKEGYAVPNFDVWSAEMLSGVMDSAEKSKSPVILAFGSGFFNNVDFVHFAAMMISMAKAASVPVAIHWDHGEDIKLLKQAESCGFNSVMLDCSALAFEENIRLTQEAVEYFHANGIPVESELGHIGPEMDYEQAMENYGFTDPMLADEYVRKTGIDALAVAIGNAHGPYTSEPRINFDILERVRATVYVPLVLHGASGISDADIKICIKMGISKINIHTELCQAAVEAIKPLAVSGASLLAIGRAARTAVELRAEEKIILFGSNNRA